MSTLRRTLRGLIVVVVLPALLACDGLLGPPEIDPSEKPSDEVELVIRDRRAPSKAEKEIPIEDAEGVAEAVKKLRSEWGEVVQVGSRYVQPLCAGRPLELSIVGRQLHLTIPGEQAASNSTKQIFDMIRGRENAGRVNLTVENQDGDSGPAAFRWVNRTQGLGQWDLPGHRFLAMASGSLPKTGPCPEETKEE